MENKHAHIHTHTHTLTHACMNAHTHAHTHTHSLTHLQVPCREGTVSSENHITFDCILVQ